ncbi:YciI family protein [Schlegelella sp. S2-27]|uniref:YciI family protein n=1 Tax=Caldimonas mangrovi TaxID=2944811 RepID=A0ABT0YSM2_9BURK|nr:YciI family protein [Caldimonas mangrovi]MCM5681743.1 YciI family protein [Caldimonas mangrovi]
MTKYLISFPSSAMLVPEEDFQAVSDEARAVVAEAQAAGVYVFAGGINEGVAPVRVSADGSLVEGTYPETRKIEGGYMILELPSREAAQAWAAKIAVACRCDQELREFMYDPLS